MKEKIYTIPVMDAFQTDCECPLCTLEQKLEDECIEYTLGPSMMEPDSRIESNQKGFCKYHFKLLYQQNNRLSLALILSTHIMEINKNLSNEQNQKLLKELETKVNKNFMSKFSSKKSPIINLMDELIKTVNTIENQCVICEKIENTMQRYLDVIFYLWKKEDEFKTLFKKSKGFCIHHYKELLEASKKYLSQKQLLSFLNDLLLLESEHLKRIQDEIDWFTKKFDYRYQDAPWGNSKDAVPRTINKIAGFSRLE